MTAVVFTKLARKNEKGVSFAPGMDEKTKRYFIFELCSNHGKGKRWVLVHPPLLVTNDLKKAQDQLREINGGMSFEDARALFFKKTGCNLTRKEGA